MCKLYYQEFPGFYSLRQHKNTQHSFSIKSTKVYPNGIINEVDDMNPKEELPSSQHFLVDCELERARQKVLNYVL